MQKAQIDKSNKLPNVEDYANSQKESAQKLKDQIKDKQNQIAELKFTSNAQQKELRKAEREKRLEVDNKIMISQGRKPISASQQQVFNEHDQVKIRLSKLEKIQKANNHGFKIQMKHEQKEMTEIEIHVQKLKDDIKDKQEKNMKNSELITEL